MVIVIVSVFVDVIVVVTVVGAPDVDEEVIVLELVGFDVVVEVVVEL